MNSIRSGPKKLDDSITVNFLTEASYDERKPLNEMTIEENEHNGIDMKHIDQSTTDMSKRTNVAFNSRHIDFQMDQALYKICKKVNFDNCVSNSLST